MSSPHDPRFDQPDENDSASQPRKVRFDDFQIQRTAQQQQVDEEKRVWAERQKRLEEDKPGFLKFATPRLKKLGDDMIGGRNKITSFLFGGKPEELPDEIVEPAEDVTKKPYFAEHEKLVVRVSKRADDQSSPSTLTFRNPEAMGQQQQVELNDLPAAQFHRYAQFDGQQEDQADQNDHARSTTDEALYQEREAYDEAEAEILDANDSELIEQFNRSAGIDPTELESYEVDSSNEEEMASADEDYDDDEQSGVEELEMTASEAQSDDDDDDALGPQEEETAYGEEETAYGQKETAYGEEDVEEEFDEDEEELEDRDEDRIVVQRSTTEPRIAPTPVAATSWVQDEPQIDAALKGYLDVLAGFDSFPRRAHEPRDPRADFVTLLAEQLDILREQTGAMSALFFWVNNRKQQLVLECGALDDTAHMYLSKEKRFAIEYDAVSMVVTKKKPELHSVISPQAELDLIPYYTESLGIASFAAMPVVFGEGLVGVITVDSLEEENFTAETLRLLTTHSKLISGLIRSYIEKYDLLASARTLEAARKLYQIVSPDSSLRVLKDQRRSPEWILRALTEAASEIVDWDWLATISFDDARRSWAINSLQSKHTKPYLTPKTPIALNESLVGKCLVTGRSTKVDALQPSAIRFSLEEDRSSSNGHSFLAIPIRTTNKNYGAIAIEHSERNRFTEGDVETLEHLARSAAAALEITALSEIVEERALTDLLSGVFNKRGLTMRLNEELARAMEFDEPLTLVVFEIDSAAEFMSRFSQEDVDTIILGVTRLLRYGARPFDVIARIGDHTFAALLVKMSDEEGYLWSEKMRKMIVSEVIAVGKRSFSVTVSIGVAGARRDQTTEELIEGAELALERAKELGGNNVIVY